MPLSKELVTIIANVVNILKYYDIYVSIAIKLCAISSNLA